MSLHLLVDMHHEWLNYVSDWKTNNKRWSSSWEFMINGGNERFSCATIRSLVWTFSHAIDGNHSVNQPDLGSWKKKGRQKNTDPKPHDPALRDVNAVGGVFNYSRNSLPQINVPFHILSQHQQPKMEKVPAKNKNKLYYQNHLCTLACYKGLSFRWTMSKG